MKPAQRLRQIAQPTVNEVSRAADIVRAAELLEDCERYIRAEGGDLRTPQWRAALLERLAGPNAPAGTSRGAA